MKCPMCGNEQDSFELGCGNCTETDPGKIWENDVAIAIVINKLKKHLRDRIITLASGAATPCDNPGAFADKRIKTIIDFVNEEICDYLED